MSAVAYGRMAVYDPHQPDPSLLGWFHRIVFPEEARVESFGWVSIINYGLPFTGKTVTAAEIAYKAESVYGAVNFVAGNTLSCALKLFEEGVATGEIGPRFYNVVLVDDPDYTKYQRGSKKALSETELATRLRHIIRRGLGLDRGHVTLIVNYHALRLMPPFFRASPIWFLHSAHNDPYERDILRKLVGPVLLRKLSEWTVRKLARDPEAMGRALMLLGGRVYPARISRPPRGYRFRKAICQPDDSVLEDVVEEVV